MMERRFQLKFDWTWLLVAVTACLWFCGAATGADVPASNGASVSGKTNMVLFVCTANICRSPMAEGMFRHMIKGRTDFRVASAGVYAVEGYAPSDLAMQVMKEWGIDISHQRSRLLSPEMVKEADYIFVMTRGHREAICQFYPAARQKTFLLRDFIPNLNKQAREVPDPIGMDYLVYVQCRTQIRQGLESLLKYIDQKSSISRPTR